VNIAVREARESDAAAVTDLVRRSISQLCAADHQNEPARLEPWLSNKTVANVTAWIAAQRNYCVVATADSIILGVGVMTIEGEVLLCYVDPDARFRGVSTAVLSSLEQRARTLGLSEVYLDSTVTARRFYEDRGYKARPETRVAFGTMPCQPVVKRLAP